jgi:hypothetical protein
MYTLDCSYYKKFFYTLDDLLADVIKSGMDPSYNILFVKDGVIKNMGETAANLLGLSE